MTKATGNAIIRSGGEIIKLGKGYRFHTEVVQALNKRPSFDAHIKRSGQLSFKLSGSSHSL